MAFEYDVYTTPWGHGAPTASIVKELNKRGAAGWKLVSTTRDESPDDDHDEEVVMFVFMRDGKNGKSTNGNGHKKSEKKKDKKGKKKN